MGGLSNIASAGINLALAQQANQRANKEINRDRDNQIAEISAQSAARQREQQSALRQRVASLRARAGAAGVTTSGGSIDAIIRGLQQEAKNESQEIDSAAQRQIDEIRESASNSRRRSLLSFTSRVAGLSSGSRSLLP